MPSHRDTATTTTRTTPPTTTRSAGGTRPPGAPRTAPVGHRSSGGAWAWIVGLIVVFAVIWFIWWWWTGQDIDADAEIGALGAPHEVGMTVPAVERGFSYGPALRVERERLVLTA